MKNKIHLLVVFGLALGFGACSRKDSGPYDAGNPTMGSGPSTQESSTSTSTTTVSDTGARNTATDTMHQIVGHKNEGSGLHTTGTGTASNTGSR